jgi:hypothetical protein
VFIAPKVVYNGDYIVNKIFVSMAVLILLTPHTLINTGFKPLINIFTPSLYLYLLHFSHFLTFAQDSIMH